MNKENRNFQAGTAGLRNYSTTARRRRHPRRLLALIMATGVFISGIALTQSFDLIGDTDAHWTNSENVRGEVSAGAVGEFTDFTCHDYSGTLQRTRYEFLWNVSSEPESNIEHYLVETSASPNAVELDQNATSYRPDDDQSIFRLGTTTLTITAIGPGGWASTVGEADIFVLELLGLRLVGSCTVR